MTNFQDCTLGYKAESTFATYATPDRFLEPTADTLQWTKNIKQGQGMRSGSRVDRSARRAYITGAGSGNVEFEIANTGQGSFWTHAMGTSASNATTAAYQQLHTLGDLLSSATLQRVVPQVDGTADPYTFLGCTVSQFEIDNTNQDFLMGKFTFDIADITTSESAASVSYATEPVSLFHWGQGVAEIGGTLTAPTTTAIGSTTSEISVGVRDFNIQVNNNLNTGRYNYGNSGRKAQQVFAGNREITGKFTAEYDQTTLRDDYLNETDVPLLITWTGGLISGSDYDVFQVALPVVRLESPGLPQPNSGDLITVDYTFKVMDGLDDDPIYLTQVTADTAL